MMRSIRCTALLVAGVCLLSAAVHGGEAAAPPPSGGPQVARIVTSDGRMLVGEVLEDTKDGVRILDLRSGAEVTVAVDTIKVRENALAAQEAIKWVGLPSYLAWRIKKESDLNPKGKIITVTPTTIYLSLGQRDGVEKGDKVNVYRESETLSDPDTGEVLGKVRARIGELEVIEVQEKFSKAKRLSELEVEFKAGDVAESTKTKKAVAVFPIVPAKDDQKEMAMLVTERFTTELASHGVPLVERALLDHGLIEMGLQTTALVDQDKAVKLGQLIGAQSVLTGTLGSVTAGKVEVNARLIKVTTGEVLVAGSEELRVEFLKNKEDDPPAPRAAQPVSPLRVPAGPLQGQPMAPTKGVSLPTRVTLRPAGNVTMDFVLIPAGEFTMGSPADEAGRGGDEAQHTVRITRPFYMATTEVTCPQWTAVMGTQPWGREGREYYEQNAAATQISWQDATAFCRRFGAAVGRTADLPTEAEWEYACRAGTSTAYSFGADPGQLRSSAWYKDNAGKWSWSKRVGQRRPNPWGLYDMHGNVWEWCQDWWQPDYYGRSPAEDPLCMEPVADAPLKCRVLRGGSWAAPAEDCRSAKRYPDGPDHANAVNGFRVVVRP